MKDNHDQELKQSKVTWASFWMFVVEHDVKNVDNFDSYIKAYDFGSKVSIKRKIYE